MEYCMLGTSAFHKVQQQLMMPRKAFLSQKEKQARARERDMLKKRRRRQDYLKRSVEPQRNTETIKWHRDDEKRRENEQVKDKDIKKRWRQDERERRRNVDAMNWRREDEKRENERGLLLSGVTKCFAIAIKPELWAYELATDLYWVTV